MNDEIIEKIKKKQLQLKRIRKEINELLKELYKPNKSAIEWINNRHPDWKNNRITKTDFTVATNNNRDRWVRVHVDRLFNKITVGRTTYYEFKKELI